MDVTPTLMKRPCLCHRWGYTGADYATSLGPQVATVANMVSALAGAFGLHNTTAARSLDGPKVRAALRAFAATRTN